MGRGAHTTSEVIGDCGLQFLPSTTTLELGFHFAPAYWGLGLCHRSRRGLPGLGTHPPT